MANKSDFSIDDILSSLGADKEKNVKPTKVWSMEDIDALLGVGEKKTVKSVPENTEKGTHDLEISKITVFGDEALKLANAYDEEDSTSREEGKSDTDSDSEIEIETVEEINEKSEDSEETQVPKNPKKSKFSKASDSSEKLEKAANTADSEEVEEAEDFEAAEEIETAEEFEEAEDFETEEDFDEEKKPEPVSQKTRVFSAKTVKVHRAEVPVEYEQSNLFDMPEDSAGSDDSDGSDEKVSESTMIIELADDTEPEDPEEKRALAGKTVGIYPVRNDSIEHQIITEKVERSGGMETDKYRERFLNKPKQHLERTADYERLHPEGPTDPIERPGMIIKKSKFTNTADLEPIPTIISADAELNNFDKTIVAKGDSNTIMRDDDDFISGQMRLGGFGEEEEIEQIDEESAEEKLRQKRDKKIASFRLDPDFADLGSDMQGSDEYVSEEDEDEYEASEKSVTDFIDDEFDYPSDAKRIKATVSNAKRATAICTVIQAVLTVIALVITSIISTAGGNLELIGGSPLTCGVINIVILVLAMICGANTLIRGVRGLKERKPNASTGTLLVAIACLLENVVIAFFTSDAYAPVSVFTAAGCLALTLANASKWLVLARTEGNLEFITNGTQLYSSEKIDDEDDAFEIGRGLLIGEPEICYNAKVSHPKKFIENSFEDDPADEFAEKLVPVVAGAAFLSAVIYGIAEHSIVVAFGIFAAVSGLAMPAFTLIASNIALFAVNREFNRTGAAIIGHRAVNESTDINAYVLDSTDIFRKGTCSIIGIKTFHNMRIDDAILYAASLVVESGGPLGDVFGNVILGKRELLPPVESLAYEEKLGLSAWIHGRRILVGSRDLLKNHNVEAPERDFEAQYTHDGRKVIYLAIAGKIAAMFVIQYHPDKHMRRYLQNVDKTGISLLVRSCDCNITEEMICTYFNLPMQAVKVLSPVSGDIFQKYRTASKDDAKAGILHNGTIEASLKTIYEAGELFENIAVNNIVSTVYMGIALLLFIIMSVLAGPMGVTGAQVVLFQILWGVIAAAIPVLKIKLNR